MSDEPIEVEESVRCIGEAFCNYQEPHDHGFACDYTCLKCAGR